jgi:hypothetical protein
MSYSTLVTLVMSHNVFNIHHSIIDHHRGPSMLCVAIWLPKSVVADGNPIQMPTLHLGGWAENAGLGVSQWTAETVGIWLDPGVLTAQRIGNTQREHIWENTWARSIIKKQGSGPKQWNLLINCCLTRISDLESKRLLCKVYMADTTNLNDQEMKATLYESV